MNVEVKLPTKALFTLPPRVETRRTERGDLLEWFMAELAATWDENRINKRGKRCGKLTIKRVANYLTGIPTKDLYVLKSKMVQARIPSSVVFFLEIKAR